MWRLVGCLRATRSFHYWQPASRWKPLPRLENPDHPVVNPRTEGETGRHPSHWLKWLKTVRIKSVGKGKGIEGRMLITRPAHNKVNAWTPWKNAIQKQHFKNPEIHGILVTADPDNRSSFTYSKSYFLANIHIIQTKTMSAIQLQATCAIPHMVLNGPHRWMGSAWQHRADKNGNQRIPHVNLAVI